jgi:hypothetical protein
MLCTAGNLRRSPTVSEEYKLNVFEAKVLRNRFGSKINKVASGKHRLKAYENRIKGIKVKLSLCLTNQALRHEGVWGSGCLDPQFLDLGTSWR